MATAPGAIRRIGVLGASTGELYTQHVIEGIRDAAFERGASVVCFDGGFIAADTQQEGGFIYSYITPELVDGLIIIAANTLRSYEELGGVAKRFAGVPVVNIGHATAGVPGVVVDNETGFRRVIEHLIDVHRRRRLAYIGGPSGNADAEIRYGVYCEVLTRHGIPIERGLVGEGHFEARSGAAVMEAIIDRGATFDAVVAANDATALGALQVLKDRGISVQDDVSVVGFDDDTAGQSAEPPLTTVRQPTARVGAEAVQMLFDWAAHGRVTPCVVVPTEVVIRQSCGCFVQAESRDASQATPPPSSSQSSPDELGRALKRQKLPGQDRAAELWNALRADITSGRPSRFRRAVLDALVEARADPGVLSRWQHTLSVVRQMLLSDVPDAGSKEIGDRLLHEARVTVAEAMGRAFTAREEERHNRVQAVNTYGERLSTAPDFDTMVRELNNVLTQLALAGCQLAMFEGEPSVVRVVLARSGTRGTGVRLEPSTPFPTQQALLEAIGAATQPSFTLVLPIAGTTGPRGFILFHGDPGDALYCVPLQTQLAANVRRLEREHAG